MKAIRSQEIFNDFRNHGVRYRTYGITLVTRSHGDSDHEMGVAVITPKRIGNAVTRNLVRRRIKSYFHLYHKYISAHYDYLLITYPGITSYTYHELEIQLHALLKKAGKFLM